MKNHNKMIHNLNKIGLLLLASCIVSVNSYSQAIYPVVDTGQEQFYNNSTDISEPTSGSAFFGQDANYSGNQPSYTNNGDGTITDNVTGLMWIQSPDFDNDGDIDYDDKMSYFEAMAAADTFSLAGYNDWRLPSIKEMYSLIIFSGKDPSGYEGTSTEGLVPFIDTDYFEFGYGDLNAGERIIDAQLASSTIYVSTTMNGNETMFGVNFADGRIKGYPNGTMPGQTVDKQFYVMYVRGNTSYGENSFINNSDNTITDQNTGLMWAKYDNGQGLNWQEALEYAEGSTIAGYSDWRLPNAKELQSIVDYSRSPSTHSTAAIDPLFDCTSIIDGNGATNYPQYWTGTTHENWATNNSAAWGAYVCFGDGQGWMEQPPNSGNFTLMDVHGAGAQRSDPKAGDPNDYPYGHGPQGDVVYVYNYVRLVRDASGTSGSSELNSIEDEIKIFPNPVTDILNIKSLNNTTDFQNSSIFSSDGKLIKSINNFEGLSLELDVNWLSPGFYFIKLESSEGIVSSKFIKE